MNILLAHHLEAHHFPVLVCLFAAGFYIGWQVLSRWLTRRHGVTADPAGKGRAGDSRG
jgi:hypothetical protein